jgi:hypothetical protein
LISTQPIAPSAPSGRRQVVDGVVDGPYANKPPAGAAEGAGCICAFPADWHKVALRALAQGWTAAAEASGAAMIAAAAAAAESDAIPISLARTMPLYGCYIQDRVEHGGRHCS